MELPVSGQDRIVILAVIPQDRVVELARVFSHTRWEVHVVHSVADGLQALQSLPISVVLCEHRLPDGTWLDLMSGINRIGPRPEVIVLSNFVDLSLWHQVLNAGGWDVLAIPLEPRALYRAVPVAWQRNKCAAQRTCIPQGELQSVCGNASAR